MSHLRHILWAFSIASLSACSALPQTGDNGLEDPQGNEGYLFRAEMTIQDEWFHMPLRGKTDYRLVVFDGQVAIRAVGQESASGLIRRVLVDPELCREMEWTWAVTKLQSDAILFVKEREDVAASIFLMFGDPGFMLDPKPVPTLRYVWTNESVEIETIIDNPYLKGTVRSIVIEAGQRAYGSWVIERRNILEDFERAFGRKPDDKIHAIAIFTDNDQTKQAVEAYYGWARVHCIPGAGPIDANTLWQ